MSRDQSGNRWYALQLRTRWESSTASILSGKGYQTFLPTSKTLKRGGGRCREQEAPLFPGYLFCRFDVHNRLPILVTPGVISVVGRGRIPVPIEDSEIEAIQKAVCTGFGVEPCPYVEVGQLVRIEGGALSGIEGILTGVKGTRRIVLSVSLLRRSVVLEIDRSEVRAIEPAAVSEEREVRIRPVPEPLVA